MYHFIVNPHSGSGRGIRVWGIVEPVLKEEHTKYRVYFTRGVYHAFQFANQITLENDRCIIIILGGDGTINEVISGISDYSKVTLGYIPTGSSNDLAKDMGLKTDPLKALRAILAPKRYYYKDIGSIQYGHSRKNFAVSTGIGFDAAVCSQAIHSKLKDILNKIGLGRLTYLGIGLKQLLFGKRTDCTVVLDENRQIHCSQLLFLAAMIHQYEGGGLKFCPKAKYDDGYLDICVIENMSFFKCLLVLPFAYIGKHHKFRGITLLRAKQLRIITEAPLPVHTDGEPCQLQREVYITLEPQQLRMIASV